MPAVSIVIVCMNRPDNLGPCLDSIKQHTTSEYEVYVVAYRFSADNLSAMKAAYPWVNFIINNSISGFSENNNLALKEVKSEYCFILNDDTELPGPTIDRLIADFKALPPDAAIVAAKLLNADGSLQLCGRPDYPAFRYVLQQWHLYSEPTDNGKGLFRTFNVSGAAFLIKTAIFKELGWFDERYFFTPEDIALGQLLNDMGKEVWTDADVSITHLAGATAGPMETAIKPTRVRGSLIFYSGGRPIVYALMGAFIWCVEALRALRWLPARRSDPRSHAAIMYRSARNVMGSIFTRKSTKQIFTELYKEVPR